MTLASLALTGTWLYVVARDLVRREVGAQERRAVTRRALTTSVVFAASIPFSLFGPGTCRPVVARRPSGRSNTRRSADGQVTARTVGGSAGVRRAARGGCKGMAASNLRRHCPGAA